MKISVLVSFLFFVLLSFDTAGQFVKIMNSPVTTDGLESHGAAWIDYDRDGDDDLFVVISHSSQGGLSMKDVLYRNNGDGTFTRISTGTLAESEGTGRNSTWADYNNDGFIDVFVADQHQKFLYKNEGSGVFTKITNPPSSEFSFSVGDLSGGVWGDYNNDGYVDLYVSSYRVNGSGRNLLYTNNGDGSFTEAGETNIVSAAVPGMDPSMIDYNGDGTLDIFVPVYFGNNLLFKNQGDGKFTSVSNELTTLYSNAVGASWADFDNDGDFDVLVQNNVNQNNGLFSNNGDGTFTKITSAAANSTSTSSAWGDFDNDGLIDLVHVGIGQEGKTTLFRNNGDKTFTDISSARGIDNNNYSWAVALSDYNKDGFLDIFIGNGYGNNHPADDILYKNTPNANGWINLALTGTKSNRSAIGAVIKIITPSGKQFRTVQSKTGYSSQNSLNVHFGIGTHPKVDTLQVYWPGKGYQELTAVQKNQFVVITEIDFPATPLSLEAKNPSYGKVEIKWADQSNNESGFRIERSVGNAKNFKLIATTASNVSTYIDKSVPAGDSVYYRVAAAVQGGFSLYSRHASVFSRKKPAIALEEIGEMDLDAQTTLKAVSNCPTPIRFIVLEGKDKVSLQSNLLTSIALGEAVVGAYQEGNNEYVASDTVRRSVTIINIVGLEKSLSTSVFPNPVTDDLQINMHRHGMSYVIMDARGQKVEEGEIKKDSAISLKHLTAGVYLLAVGNKRIRFVKK